MQAPNKCLLALSCPPSWSWGICDLPAGRLPVETSTMLVLCVLLVSSVETWSLMGNGNRRSSLMKEIGPAIRKRGRTLWFTPWLASSKPSRTKGRSRGMATYFDPAGGLLTAGNVNRSPQILSQNLYVRLCSEQTVFYKIVPLFLCSIADKKILLALPWMTLAMDERTIHGMCENQQFQLHL